ncbi:hypothetical protein [Spirosoma arboris]|uniref:hypothetical protein n=1 Tax=Spirosoma arboris TaxID=2682092 RepID=UPI001D10DB4D|nr:hypothetical protein [Spirosoma arboris]
MLNDVDHDSLELLDVKAVDRLRIASGAFIDHEGEVMSTQGKTIVVKIESLQVYVR